MRATIRLTRTYTYSDSRHLEIVARALVYTRSLQLRVTGMKSTGNRWGGIAKFFLVNLSMLTVQSLRSEDRIFLSNVTSAELGAARAVPERPDALPDVTSVRLRF